MRSAVDIGSAGHNFEVKSVRKPEVRFRGGEFWICKLFGVFAPERRNRFLRLIFTSQIAF